MLCGSSGRRRVTESANLRPCSLSLLLLFVRAGVYLFRSHASGPAPPCVSGRVSPSAGGVSHARKQIITLRTPRRVTHTASETYHAAPPGARRTAGPAVPGARGPHAGPAPAVEPTTRCRVPTVKFPVSLRRRNGRAGASPAPASNRAKKRSAAAKSSRHRLLTVV